MITRIKDLLIRNRSLQKINFAVARGVAASSLRTIDITRPASWEFSGFSQNGEDGILDVLLRQVCEPNRYFIEIGTADGLENNTSWLSLVHRYCGLCIEGDPKKSEAHRSVFTPMNYGLTFLNLFVTTDSLESMTSQTRTLAPDVFSLDIDGNDYYIAKAVLEAGFRPKIFVVEYNSAFGPEKSVTIPYSKDFRIGSSDAERLYYGCSVAGWKCLFKDHGYRFVTVDQNGVNAVFVAPDAFPVAFLDQVSGTHFAENFSQLTNHRSEWPQQYALLRGQTLHEIKAGQTH
ncbi:MAG TPA: hypothetical protein DDZ51_15290 [Planctomycetaceae bacterium]|nr:hypothetical protein [Planctomycetaceae bacterium]